jgi:hypothetical protein
MAESVATGEGGIVGPQVPAQASTARRIDRFMATGINTADDITGLMSDTICDLIEGKLETRMAGTLCNAAGRILKAEELKQRYGTIHGGNRTKQLAFTRS